LLAEDVEVPIVGANLIRDIVWAAPLVNNFLDHVLVPVQAKSDGPLVRLPARVALDFQVHAIYFLLPEDNPLGFTEVRDSR